ncbi:MAG: T9SS type A sorting domain-containing protein [Bacteroidota bacterium]
MKILLRTLFLVCIVLAGTSAAKAQTTPDPGLPGPLAVTKAQYNMGDLAATLPHFPTPVEIRGSVHYPTSMSAGPYPVLFFLHGRHSTCYNTSTLAASSAWPCPAGRLPIVSYEGYDYQARQMASHGFIVISISCNAINAGDASLSDAGMYARGELVQYHMRLWDTINTTGHAPFGTLFVGKLDMQNIGTMGHSRGGEGVVFNSLHNDSLGKPFGIKAVITLAPVDFRRRVLTKIPLLNIAPYCDGDVSNIQGVRFYDDARYRDATDEAPKYSVLMMGANHNFYNTVWTPGSYIAGTSDDWTYAGSSTSAHCGMSSASSKRLDSTKQKAAYNAYASAFFRMFMKKETQFEPILDVTDIHPPASSLLDTTQVFVSYHAGRTDRLDINRIDSVYNETVNNLGGTVTSSGLLASGICNGGLAMPSCGIATTTTQEPHKGSTTIKGVAQLNTRWDDTADYYENQVPVAYQDVRFVNAIQFRTALKYTECTPGQSLAFTVRLIDSAGAVSNEVTSDHSLVLFYPPGTTTNVLPKVLFNTLRIALDSFSGVNMAKIRKIRFAFNQSATGSILITDLAFINEKCGKFDATYGFTMGTGHNVLFKDTLTANTNDTLTWLWKFGEPSSGVNDTSTLHNPTHVYASPGTYTACLYIQIKRPNGRICADTICKTIPFHLGVGSEAADDIAIYPNPAKDQLTIAGADESDVLRLVNVYGQVVLEATLAQVTVKLPQHLANGIYYAIVTTAKGTVYKKLLIER